MDIPLHSNCTLIASHPCGLLAVDKETGILSHPNSSTASGDALLQAGYDHENEAYTDGKNHWFLLNRLDGPTSGVILLATDRNVAAGAKSAFARHAVEKSYLAVVKGIPPAKKAFWRDCLETSRKGGQLRTHPARGGINAETAVLMEKRGSGPPARSMIRLDPVTGRTHQLRVQCAARRLPVLGDATYGDFEFNRSFRRKTGSSRLFLHSWRTCLELLVEGKPVSFLAESPVPGIFAVALQ